MMAPGSPSGIVILGYQRSLIELRNNLGALPGHLMLPVIAVIAITVARNSGALSGSGGSFGNYALIGIALLNTLLSGVMGTASTVMQERMDGTLLRSSCLPHGTTAYAISKVLSQFQLTLAAFALALPLLWLATGRTAPSPVSATVLLVIAPAGLLSLLPLAVVVGAMLRSPRQLSLASIGVMLIGAASGAFQPMGRSGGLAQAGAMTLPTFWVSASLRNALLPGSAHWGDPSDLAVLVGGLMATLAWLILGVALARKAVRRASRRPGGRRAPSRHKAREGGRHARRAGPKDPRASGTRARHRAATRSRRRSSTHRTPRRTHRSIPR